MKIVDVNVLLYLVDSQSASHATVRQWWENALNTDDRLGLSVIVLLGFVRIATNPRVYPQPLTPDQAFQQIDAWLAHPHVEFVVDVPSQWVAFANLLRAMGGGSNQVSDAYLASVAIALDATLVSCDTDFSTYPGLKWENPCGPT